LRRRGRESNGLVEWEVYEDKVSLSKVLVEEGDRKGRGRAVVSGVR
jgi:hypothetical protein